MNIICSAYVIGKQEIDLESILQDALQVLIHVLLLLTELLEERLIWFLTRIFFHVTERWAIEIIAVIVLESFIRFD